MLGISECLQKRLSLREEISLWNKGLVLNVGVPDDGRDTTVSRICSCIVPDHAPAWTCLEILCTGEKCVVSEHC